MPTNKFSKVCLLIPAYNPGEELVGLIAPLLAHDFRHVIVVNDGSADGCESIFSEIETLSSVTVLHHSSNRGKGAALKTGFEYYLEHFSSDSAGLVTLDADGQHLVQDVFRVAEELIRYPDKMILGVRSFGKKTPLRSRFGNMLTRKILELFFGIALRDTQTGLRGMPAPLLRECLKLSANRYDFEAECLICARKLQFDFFEVPIETVYIDRNRFSHFRPLFDSARIYFVFSRFILLSLVCFVIDVGLFAGFFAFIHSVFWGTFLSRIISGSVNFYYNKFSVFKSHDRSRISNEFVLYVLLASVLIILSSNLVYVLAIELGFNVLYSKICVDSVLFMLSFMIQRSVIFRSPIRSAATE